MQVPISLLNLDMCLLVYQFYHQSVIWPLDPWYEKMGRKLSSRRDNFVAEVHDWAQSLNPDDLYSGPAAARGWGESNTILDPVMTNYNHIRPHLPGFSGGDENVIAVKAPSYLTDSIKLVEIATYASKPSTEPLNGPVNITEICDYPNGENHVIAFEGGTGSTSKTVPAWSMLGFVMMSKRPDKKGHDVHIAFRGSRGGAVLSSVIHKNPDWFTDLRNISPVSEPHVSKVGSVGGGFRSSVKTCMGSVAACLDRIHRFYGKPENIYVTGHSLGGALAAQFTAAVSIGKYGEYLRRTFADWPWDDIVCMPYALPCVGDETFKRAFDLVTNARYIWVDGDVVVTAGKVSSKHVGAGVKLALPTGAKENPHETHLIRSAIIRDIEKVRPQLPSELKTESPWAYYKTFGDMLSGTSSSHMGPGMQNHSIITERNFRSVLNNYHFSLEFEHYLDIFKKVIAMKSSYKKPNLFSKQKKLDKRKNRVDALIDSMQNFKNKPKDQQLNLLVAEVASVDDLQGSNTEKFLGLGVILNGLANSSLSISDIKSQDSLKRCWEAKIKV